MARYKRPLKVSNLSGERIVASIATGVHKVTISIPYLECIEKDNPDFAVDGVIRFSVLKEKYQKAIFHLTKYLEDLFLKEISNENNSSGVSSGSIAGRNNKKSFRRTDKKDEGERSSVGVHVSAGRNKQTKGIGGGKPDSDMDKVHNTQIEGQN